MRWRRRHRGRVGGDHRRSLREAVAGRRRTRGASIYDADVAGLRDELVWRAGLLAALVAIAAACGSAPSTVPATPEVSCSDTRFDPPPVPTCGAAVAVATTALPFLHPRIVSIEFAWGAWCPPGARCLASMPTVGHVIFRFVSGEPLLVHVALDETTGAVTVTDSEPLPKGGAGRVRITMTDMLRGATDDATTRYLEEVAADIKGLLGPGIELLELAIEAGPVVVLRARYGMADETIESVGRGESVIEAHARLRGMIIGDRVGLGLRVLV